MNTAYILTNDEWAYIVNGEPIAALLSLTDKGLTENGEPLPVLQLFAREYNNALSTSIDGETVFVEGTKLNLLITPYAHQLNSIKITPIPKQ
jgi:hypothetical protein